MSRPSTRSKSKKNRNDDIGDNFSEILRKIYSTGNVSEDDIIQIYSIWKPVCGGCRINSKDNPNCFCGFIPSSNGVRKSGLWQKMSEIIAALGPDPCTDLRPSLDWPAGLTNLGATCYANSILQCLYMNKAFRAGLFSAEPELFKQHPVLDQLARLFAQLHSSRRAFIDSAPFIQTLELDSGVQQDSHEFLTLLLSLLERFLSLSKVPKAKTVVQDLFRGIVSHVTRCSVCGKDSEASAKMEDFYELELNIKGFNNLDESLDDYLSMEELHGENQYFCESCRARVDATRCIKLRTLPTVLNFQLKRYVFLPKTTTKKKITSVFSFPQQLNMGRRLCSTSRAEIIYDLSAILIHKGSAVESGHYIAHIKEESSGQWWEFDDEHVSRLGLLPFGEGSSSLPAKPESIMQNSCSEPVVSIDSKNHTDIGQSPFSVCNAAGCTKIFSSADAYMLMYSRRNPNEKGDTNINSSVDMMDVDGQPVSRADEDNLPDHLAKEIEELNRSHDDACKYYQQQKEIEVQKITERRSEVKLILSEAPVSSVNDPFFWISTDWFRQWADSFTCLSIDNTFIQCSHLKVPISKVGSMKRISEKAWKKLFSKYEGGPALNGSDYCTDCLKDTARTAASADTYRDLRATMKQAAEEALDGNCLEGNLYYVSKAWLSQWLRRRNVDAPCDADVGPTASLRCPHEGLLPEQAVGAKRLLVPESLWHFFLECANKVKPDDSFGCMAFPSDSETCAVCSIELTEVASSEDRLRETKVKHRQNHDKLYQGKTIAVSPGCKYYLIPSSWLSKWRKYVTSTGKSISTSVEPESLECVIDSLKCEKHSRLLLRPPDLVCKRGEFVQKTSNIDGLTIITEIDWRFFCEEWEVPERKGICAEIDFLSCTKNKVIGSSSETLILDTDMDTPNGVASDAPESRNPFIRPCPEICEECIGERESCELMSKLNYSNEEIRVLLVRGKEAPRSILEASGIISEPDRRTSKRSRKASNGGSVSLYVSGTTSVYQLKMMIWESFGVVKENQKLHKGSIEICDESATLADMNIFPGDVLWVSDTQIHENRDIAEELSEQVDLQRAEEGFRGTLLASNGLA